MTRNELINKMISHMQALAKITGTEVGAFEFHYYGNEYRMKVWLCSTDPDHYRTRYILIHEDLTFEEIDPTTLGGGDAA